MVYNFEKRTLSVLGEPRPPFFEVSELFFDIWWKSLESAWPSQGLYEYRTTQHRKRKISIHASRGIRTHDSSIQGAKTHGLDRAATVIDSRHHHHHHVMFL